MAWRAMDPLSAISDDSCDEEDSDAEEDDDGRTSGDEKLDGKVGKNAPAGQDGASAVKAEVKTASKGVKKQELDFEALSRHGYSGGPSIMHVPAPKDEVDPNWSWSNGKRKSEDKAEESLEDRALTREIVTDSGEKLHLLADKYTSRMVGVMTEKDEIRRIVRRVGVCLPDVQMAAQAIAEANFMKKQKRDAAAEQRALSFSQKEKRKRDLGQATRAKNYVEEEKRLLRDQGVYSGFDT